MYVTYDPELENEPSREWNFDPEDLGSRDAIQIEKEYGSAIDQWVNGLRTNEAKARRLLLWHLLRETNPRLQLRDTPDFRLRQFKVQMDVAELRKLRDRVAAMKMDEDQREMVIGAIDVDIREAMHRETGVMEGEIDEPANLPKPQ
jgi:hypothetical protein